ncbi:MAG: outer membrane protein assembly factor BamB family protein [Planctomycetota bacterium]
MLNRLPAVDLFGPKRMSVIVLSMYLSILCGDKVAANPSEEAEQILEATGVKGGLVVHLGCGDGKLTAAMRANESYLVHGLEADPAKVEKARGHIRSLGLYGNVAIEHWDRDTLPYVDNLVNLLVSQNPGAMDMAEMVRVLVPNGVAYIKKDGQWTKTVKPRRKDIDEWTHYLYDSSNNAVSRDVVVAPPRHLQWVGNPRWTRHHDHMSSFNAMVSSGGRIFYIIDEGPRAEIQLPPRWFLIARDAFNGIILWKRPIENWHTQLWPLKSGPAQLPRRIIAVGDTIYAALGYDAPLSALEAATGKTIRTYQGTKATSEVLYSNGILFVLVNKNLSRRPWSTKARYTNFVEMRADVERMWAWDATPRSILAMEAQTGGVLWEKRSAVAPLTLTANETRVFFHDGTRVICLNRANGQPLWESEPITRAEKLRSWLAPTLVVHDDVVVFGGAEGIVHHIGGTGKITALTADTGKILWTGDHPPSGYDSPKDVLIIDDLVWTAPMTNRRDSGEYTGRDLVTGEIKRIFAADDGNHMPHHRCHRAKATERYILASRTGIEYVDLSGEHWNRHDWVRGACLYGIMPANGLTYAPPHSCACYILAKLNGFNALAPASGSRKVPGDVPDKGRLERGPAYADIGDERPTTGDATDWPTYRHDQGRSGFVKTSVPHKLKRAWRINVGGKISSPVIADGKLLVSSVDSHTVHALDERTGKRLWSYTAGGRIDSPPTIWRGHVLFGSADGWVYCLRTKDGRLAWRFRAAPVDRRLMSFEQLESVWPVHGSMLVRDGIVYCVAGRSMFLDGGMRLLRLDAKSGEKFSETILDRRHPETGKPLDEDVVWPNLPVALPDILSCDGRYLYMRSQAFDLNGRRCDVEAPTDFKDQRGQGAHLFSNTGFLDDSWWHRNFWLYGKKVMSGAAGWYQAAFRAPAGRIMVFDESRAYAFGRRPQYFPRTTTIEYHLFAVDKEPQFVNRDPPPKTHVAIKAAELRRRRRQPTPTKPVYDWTHQIPLLGRALVLAGKTLFVAGPPDVADLPQTINQLDDPETQKILAEQRASFEGNKGAWLWAVSAADGEKLAEYRLESMPVFDGLAAANGRLYLSTVDGKVQCFAAQ